jgi:hypothetical protein
VLKVIFAIFVILHGLVHLLYAAQARRLFELAPGLAWPESSWLLSRLVGEQAIRAVAIVIYVLAAAGFVVSGIGLLFGGSWSHTAVVASAAVSTVGVILFWDGKLQRLPDQGLIAVLINIGLVIVVLMQWVPQ